MASFEQTTIKYMRYLLFLATFTVNLVFGQSDEPCGAPNLSLSGTCSFSTYTTLGATTTNSPTPPTPGCANYQGGDVWFTLIVPANGSVEIDANIIDFTDGGMAAYSGTCSSLSLIECDDDDSPNGLMPFLSLTGLIPGETIFIRFWEYGNNDSGQFEICATYAPPVNDECSDAISATITSSGGCVTTRGSLVYATPSAQTNDCAGTANDDVWYEFTAPTSGAVEISLSNITNSPTDLMHSVYLNNCGALGTAIVCSDPNTSSVTGLTPGASYLIRVFSYSSSSGASTSFDLCIQEVGPCGTPNNQDFCVAPAILTEGGGDFSSSTSGTYTSDTPANLNSVFCGSIENNSWYEFVADATTENFPISYVGGTGCITGVQAQVYEVTQDANGCCTNFTSMSNCYNPGSLTLGTVSATGLTIGNTYILMFDGFGGSVCDFTVAGWGATGILPVELVDFKGIGLSDKNVLSWSTESERNNDYFLVQRSLDAVNFETVGKLEGAGNSNGLLNYSLDDEKTRLGITYYRLQQYDFDGTVENSEIIAINRESDKSEITFVYPNPTNGIV